MRMRSVTVTALIASASLIGAAATADAQGYEQLYSFDGGGKYPDAELTEFQGKLYGTTTEGGSANCRPHCGVVFSLDLTTGQKKVVYKFQGGADGSEPMTGLTVAGGLLYGTTEQGGGVFSIDPATGMEKTVHAFGGGSDGSAPSSALLDVAGVLYGETSQGGDSGNGTIYAINLATGAEQVVYSFQGNQDGMNPNGGLINVNNVLYGTTLNGGSFSQGAVFAVDTARGVETILHSFGSGLDGISPKGHLTKVGKTFYGTTVGGGRYESGTIFSINPANGEELVVYSFGSHAGDGTNPTVGLTDVNGILFGTSVFRDGSCCGTLFSLNPATGAEAVVYSFQGGADGNYPSASLTGVGGTLYGITYVGGSLNKGTVFAFTP
jgi:uncharacterized repeat protein (TIGR03803 family)